MYVLNLSIDEPSFRAEWTRLEADAMVKVAMLLELVGIETVAFLRSITAATRPPRRAGEGPRRAHPGGWADVTGNLANAYSFEVTARGARLVWGPEGPTTGTIEKPVPTAPVQRRGVVPMRLNTREVTLWLRNTMQYAVFLEQRDGYYILSGVTYVGGPIDFALQKAANALGGVIRLGSAA